MTAKPPEWARAGGVASVSASATAMLAAGAREGSSRDRMGF
ncbi:MAG TPA: hypothetical protein VK357_01260 [Rubrobacteraceae bacterium]|nr:hypothetical protein [Rubrobacteraceae bacterium]